jgi:hypothetical protein
MREKIIETLDSFRKRTSMYIQPINADEAEKFLHGFDTGCLACGIHLVWRVIAEQRGWNRGAIGLTAEMRAAGLSDEKIIDELIEFREEAARRSSV